MRNSRHGRWRLPVLIAFATLTAALSACGSDDDDTGTVAQSTGPQTYEGVDNDLPTSFAEPTPKPGTPFTVGYLQIIGSIPVLAAEQAGAQDEVAKLGGQMIVKDAQNDPQKQVAGFEQLLSQGVDAIVVYPVVPQSLTPQLQKAKAAGIPVISTNARPDPSEPMPQGYVADVEQALDFEAFQLAKAVADEKAGASFAVMGLAAPVAALKYLAARQQYWGEQFGLKYEGTVDAATDDPAAYSAATTALLGEFPDVDAVLTYSDLAALTAATAARSAGKSGLLITGAQGGVQAALEAIEAGTVFATYAPPWAQTGAQMIRAAYNEVTEQNLPLPQTVTLKGTLITKDNADEFAAVDAG